MTSLDRDVRLRWELKPEGACYARPLRARNGTMAHAPGGEARETSAAVTRRLIERARNIECSQLPADVRAVARQCVLDWIGVTLGASSDPLPRLLLDAALADGGHPLATVVGHPVRVAPLQAALINGAASHVLDYDDGNITMIVHASVAILPGLLALAEVRGANGDAVIAAFIAAYETACRVGLLVQ